MAEKGRKTLERNHVLSILREHAPELRAAGLLHLRVFGSVAREEATKLSDVDLLAEFDPNRRITLITVGSLQCRLSDLLGTDVDLSSAEWMREPIRSKAIAEAVLVF